MIDTPHIVHTGEENTAVIHLTIQTSEMMTKFGPAVQELLAELAKQGVAPSGSLFAYHLKMPGEVFDFELGFPVNAAVKAAGRVKPSKIPAFKAARTVYHGGYEGLPSAWGDFMKWVDTEGHKAAPVLVETYVTGPAAHPDPSSWRTELTRPLAE